MLTTEQRHLRNQMPEDLGLVEPQQMQLFTAAPLTLECGRDLGPISVQYEVYGQLNAAADNAILVCHALSGDSHAAGRHNLEDSKPGWWDSMIGPGKAFDTRHYCVICSNFLGGCKGTTGPSSINVVSGKPFSTDFPMITIGDMVMVQQALVAALGIDQLLAVVGGSMGGMQALEWAVRFPQKVRSVIPIATTHRMSAQGIAFNEVARQSIFADPNWNAGDYYNREVGPVNGLAIARMIGHITYLSDQSMHAKFGRNRRDRGSYAYNFETEFQVESYLHYQGSKFTERFDANTYLYITKAMDYFDLSAGYPSLRHSLRRSTAKFLLISFSSDWLFPPGQMKEVANALRSNGTDVTYLNLSSDYGHDAFLLEVDELTKVLTAFLRFLGGTAA